MKIWLGSEYDYGNGCLSGEWIELTGDYEADLSEAMEKYSYGGRHDVSVMDTDIQPDEPWTTYIANRLSLEQLEELVAAWNAMDDYSKDKVRAATEGYGAHEVVEIFTKIDEIEFWKDMTLEDVAEELVDEGCFGTIPDSIRDYVDYKAIARDLNIDGYCETDYGTVYKV